MMISIASGDTASSFEVEGPGASTLPGEKLASGATSISPAPARVGSKPFRGIGREFSTSFFGFINFLSASYRGYPLIHRPSY